MQNSFSVFILLQLCHISPFFLPQVWSWNRNVIGLKHNDRIALGHCAYVFLVVDPAAVLNAVLAASNNNDNATNADSSATNQPNKPGGNNKKWPFFGNKKSPEAAVEEALQPGGDATGGDGGGNGSLKVFGGF